MTKFTCPECGKTHDELPAFAFEGPTFWYDATPEERERDFEIGPDLCRYKGEEHHLIRGLLRIPVVGEPENPLSFVVWAAVSKDNFWRYRTTFMDFNADSVGVFYGYLANAIPGYDSTVNLKVAIEPQGQAQRPLFHVIEAPDNALQQDQQEGMSADNAMKYLHRQGGF